MVYDAAMLTLHRLKLERFRSLRPCDLRFHSGFNVLLGKNGSGKTTLLRLLADLYSQSLSDILKDEEFELELELLDDQGTLQQFIRSESGWTSPQFRSHATTDALPPSRCILELVQFIGSARQPVRLDESLERLSVLQSMRWTVRMLRTRPLMVIPSDVGQPADLMAEFSRAVNADPERERISIGHSALGFLRCFVDLVGLHAARVTIERVEKRHMRGGGLEPVFSNFRFYFTRRDGSEFPQDHLSYGQKRLLIFLYCQAAIPQVMIADELVNGLHHDWIERCMDMIRDRQCFLSSQNPLLLDHLYFHSQEEVQRTFILCSSEPARQGPGHHEGEGDVMHWRNMSEAEAAAVYGAYQTGVQHVSEILHSLGLW